MNGSVKQRILRGIPMDYIIHYDVAAFVITLHFCCRRRDRQQHIDAERHQDQRLLWPLDPPLFLHRVDDIGKVDRRRRIERQKIETV